MGVPLTFFFKWFYWFYLLHVRSSDLFFCCSLASPLYVLGVVRPFSLAKVVFHSGLRRLSNLCWCSSLWALAARSSLCASHYLRSVHRSYQASTAWKKSSTILLLMTFLLLPDLEWQQLNPRASDDHRSVDGCQRVYLSFIYYRLIKTIRPVFKFDLLMEQ